MGSRIERVEARYRAVQWVACAAPVVLLAVVGWAHRFTTDDGFIYYRVVHQITAGHGPVFNPGRRVEAFTSPLWVALLVVLDVLTPIRLEYLGVALGIGSSMAGLGLAIAGAARLVRLDARGRLLVPLGALVPLGLLPFWYWETGGLETGFVLAWLGLSLWIMARWATTPGSRIALWGAAVLGLGWLVRPEFLPVSALFVAVVVLAQWRTDRWRTRLTTLVAAGALPVAYEVFRMGYYGLLVSTTAIAKEGASVRFGRGWLYLQDFTRPYWLWVPIALLVLGAYLPLAIRLRRRRETRALLVLGAFLAAALVAGGEVVGYGGDYFHGRLLLPALFALCAPVAVIPLSKRYLAVAAVGLWALVCAVSLRPPELDSASGIAAHGFVLPPRSAIGQVTLNQVGFGTQPLAKHGFRGPGLYVQVAPLNETFRKVDLAPAPGIPLPAAAVDGIGAVSYDYTSLFVLDLHGLADPISSHLQLIGRGYPGHEKGLPSAWIAALMTASGTQPTQAEFIVPTTATTPGGTAPFPVQVAAARRALQCPALAGLERSTTAPMSVHTFLSNMLHSFSRTKLRIPSDPVAAAARFCGSAKQTLPASVSRGAPARIASPVADRLRSTGTRSAPFTASAFSRFGVGAGRVASASTFALLRAPP